MRDNCFRSDGTPRTITAAHFTVLGPGRIRWELFADGDVLNHSEMIDLAKLRDAMEITRMLISDAAGVGGAWAF